MPHSSALGLTLALSEHANVPVVAEKKNPAGRRCQSRQSRVEAELADGEEAEAVASATRPADDEIDFPAAALGTDQPADLSKEPGGMIRPAKGH
jgi:hypothetical protein